MLKLRGSFGITSTSIRLQHCDRHRVACQQYCNTVFFSCLCMSTDQDVGLIRVGFFSLLGDQQKLVKQEESSVVLGSLQTKCSFKDQLSITNQIRAFPVGQLALDFLW